MKVVEYFEGEIERNEIGVSRKVDEPTCCIGVCDEASENHL